VGTVVVPLPLYAAVDGVGEQHAARGHLREEPAWREAARGDRGRHDGALQMTGSSTSLYDSTFSTVHTAHVNIHHPRVQTLRRTRACFRYRRRTGWAGSARRRPTRRRVKVTGLAQKLGQLEAVNRDLQSKYWANLKLLLSQPCNFYARLWRLCAGSSAQPLALVSGGPMC
jgi:hypothetical protein